MQLNIRRNEVLETEPLRELKGFAKVAPAPGERKSVGIWMTRHSLLRVPPRMNGRCPAEKRPLEAGAFSRDFRSSAALY